jgi:drug/metabolite transporter (DMT)-like permease
MLAIFAYFILDEKIPFLRWVAIFCGIMGVLIIVEPSDGASYLPVVVLLLGCCSAALSDVVVRKLSLVYSSKSIVYCYFGFSLMLLAPLLGVLAFYSDKTSIFIPKQSEVLILFLIGIIGTLSQLSLTKAYQLCAASVVAPIMYFSIVWSTFAGWFVWNETITFRGFFGTLFIVMDGLLAFKSLKGKPLA